MNFYNGDERINKEFQDLYFNAYLILQALALVSLTLKMYLMNINITSISPELLILGLGNLYILIRALFLRVNIINFLKGKDEFCLIYRNKIFCEGFYLEFICLLLMMPILIIMIDRGILKDSSSLLLFLNMEFLIPCCYVTYKSMKQGLLISKVKKDKKVKKILSAILMVTIFTISMNWNILFTSEIFSYKNILLIIKDSIICIIFIIVPMNVILKRSEKNADKLSK